MTGWGAALYGDPCEECGYPWSITFPDACALLAAIPDRYRAACVGHDGTERHPDLAWPVVVYVCHVSDNFAVFVERLMGIVGSGRSEVAAYDENELAAARRYEAIVLEGALWSLEQRAPLLVEALALAEAGGIVMVHPERGPHSALDTARWIAHDARHHEWDIGRTLRPVDRPARAGRSRSGGSAPFAGVDHLT